MDAEKKTLLSELAACRDSLDHVSDVLGTALTYIGNDSTQEVVQANLIPPAIEYLKAKSLVIENFVQNH